jgi:hypothetical protein
MPAKTMAWKISEQDTLNLAYKIIVGAIAKARRVYAAIVQQAGIHGTVPVLCPNYRSG